MAEDPRPPAPADTSAEPDATDIRRRKEQHVDVVLGRDVRARDVTTGLERVRFAPVALPEIALADVDLATRFLGRTVSAPVLVSSMTGGTARTAGINTIIAEACGALGLAFAVGSQRVALEAPGGQAGFGPELRRAAPAVPILANIGAAQVRGRDAVDLARRAVEMIEADALIVHVNPLQEAVQAGGDTDWRGVLDAIGALCRTLAVPVVVKEVGAGITGDVARRLVDAGVAVIDVAGAGGTSWAAVEGERADTAAAREVAMTFRDWGIPTADAIREVRAACPDVPIVASGGLRSGLDAARALRIGADMTGFAAGVLADAALSAEALEERLSVIVGALRIACFCTGSADIAALKRARLLGN